MGQIIDANNPLLKIEGEAYRATTLADHVTYIGWAEVGTLDSVTKWKICKLTYDGADAGIISVTWPAGSRTYSYEWDERASYTYT